MATNKRGWIINWTAIGVIAMALFAAAAYGVSIAKYAETKADAANVNAGEAKKSASDCKAMSKEYIAKDEQRHLDRVRRLDEIKEAVERRHP